MISFSPCRALNASLLCGFVLLLLLAEPVEAGGLTIPATASFVSTSPAASSGSWLLADDDGWSFRHLFRSINGRARTVQFCVVTMCLALFILLKK